MFTIDLLNMFSLFFIEITISFDYVKGRKHYPKGWYIEENKNGIIQNNIFRYLSRKIILYFEGV